MDRFLFAHKRDNHMYTAINKARDTVAPVCTHTHTRDVNVRVCKSRTSHNETVVWRRKADGRRDGGSKRSARKWRRMPKVREGLHVLVQLAGPLERDTRRSLSMERETIVIFRRVAIQNTWSILAGAMNNGRLKWVCLAEEGLGKRDGWLEWPSSITSALRSCIVSFFFRTSDMTIGARVYTDEWYEYNLNIIVTFSNLHFVIILFVKI